MTAGREELADKVGLKGLISQEVSISERITEVKSVSLMGGCRGHVPAGRHCAKHKQRAMCQQGDIAKNVALCLHVAGRHCISSHGIRPIKSQDSYLRCKITK
jgi:hypothetical protein